MTAQPDLFTPIPPAAANTYHRYLLWRESPEGGKAYAIIARNALIEWRGNVRRISVNRLCEVVRVQENIHVNNTYRAWIADSLIAEYPQLQSLIETRKRTKAKTL